MRALFSALRFALWFCIAGILTTTSNIGAHELHDAAEPTPFTHLDFSTTPDDFQFAIVTDRTGGHRPGVFPAVLARLNLLQPELVMSVGDYVEGYTEDVQVAEQEWREIDAMIDENLEAPFFFVPGNHDHGTTVMAEVWKKRLGPTSYHFVYKNVLFVVLHTEDPPAIRTEAINTEWAKLGAMMATNPGGVRDFLYNNKILQPMLGQIGDAQRSSAMQALREHSDVRWTFLFMHRPIWHKLKPNNFALIEEALTGRNYTMFAGHEHNYQHLVRHDQDYVTLSTSGGGWSRPGTPARAGQMDHITWVTVRDEKPVFAHILASGIFAKDKVPAVIPGAEFCGEAYEIQCVHGQRPTPEDEPARD